MEEDETGKLTSDWARVTKEVRKFEARKTTNELLYPELKAAEEKCVKNPKSINRDLENQRELDNLTRQIGELRLHVSKLENPSKQNEDRFKPRQTIECCLYCDSSFHQRRDCKELEDDLNKKRVRLVQGKIAEYDSGKLLKLNIGNGGMKALIRNENRHQARTYAITLLEKNL